MRRASWRWAVVALGVAVLVSLPHGDRSAAGPLQRPVRDRAARQGEGVRLRRPLRLRRVRRRPRPAAHRRLHRADQPARRPHPDPVLVARRRGLAGGRGADHRRGRDVPGPERDLELGLRAGHDRAHQRADRPAPPGLRRRAGRAGPPAAVRGQGGGRVPASRAAGSPAGTPPGCGCGRPTTAPRSTGSTSGSIAATGLALRVEIYGKDTPRPVLETAFLDFCARRRRRRRPGSAPAEPEQDPRRDQPRPGRGDQRVRPGDPADDAGRAARSARGHRPRLGRHVRVGLTLLVAVPLPGRISRPLRDQLAKTPGATETARAYGSRSGRCRCC